MTDERTLRMVREIHDAIEELLLGDDKMPENTASYAYPKDPPVFREGEYLKCDRDGFTFTVHERDVESRRRSCVQSIKSLDLVAKFLESEKAAKSLEQEKAAAAREKLVDDVAYAIGTYSVALSTTRATRRAIADAAVDFFTSREEWKK